MCRPHIPFALEGTTPSMPPVAKKKPEALEMLILMLEVRRDRLKEACLVVIIFDSNYLP